MRITMKDGSIIVDVLSITPDSLGDWTVEFIYPDEKATVIDPDMVLKVIE